MIDNTHALDSAKRSDLTIDLAKFVVRAIEKYVAGQKEHGGSIRDRDLPEEIINEIIDLYFYTQALER